MEYTIEQGGPDFAELGGQVKQIQSLKDEVCELRKELKQKEIVIEKPKRIFNITGRNRFSILVLREAVSTIKTLLRY